MAIKTDPVQYALDQVSELAALPEITMKIIQVVEDPESTARDLHEIVCNDPSLSSRLLRVVNSAFFGLPGQIGSIERAIVLLGLNAVKNIAIAASLGQLFKKGKLTDSHSLKDLWTYSVGVAAVSRQLTGRLALALQEEAFLAGLIHDLGLVIGAQAFPDELGQVIERAEAGEDFEQLENELIGCTHGQLGQALAAKWKFPRGLQIVLGYHHKIDNLSQENRLLPVIVYIADVLCCHNKIGFYLTAENQPLDDLLLESVGLSESGFESVQEQLPEQIETAEAILMG